VRGFGVVGHRSRRGNRRRFLHFFAARSFVRLTSLLRSATPGDGNGATGTRQERGRGPPPSTRAFTLKEISWGVPQRPPRGCRSAASADPAVAGGHVPAAVRRDHGRHVVRGARQRFRYVTLPGPRPVGSTAVLLGVSWTCNRFAVVFPLSGDTVPATRTLVTWAYRPGFGRQPRDFTQPAAYGIPPAAILIVFTYRVLPRRAEEPGDRPDGGRHERLRPPPGTPVRLAVRVAAAVTIRPRCHRGRLVQPDLRRFRIRTVSGPLPYPRRSLTRLPYNQGRHARQSPL
jgi:hypothetical protein